METYTLVQPRPSPMYRNNHLLLSFAISVFLVLFRFHLCFCYIASLYSRFYVWCRQASAVFLKSLSTGLALSFFFDGVLCWMTQGCYLLLSRSSAYLQPSIRDDFQYLPPIANMSSVCLSSSLLTNVGAYADVETHIKVLRSA